MDTGSLRRARVLKLIAHGYTHDEIAKQLKVSPLSIVADRSILLETYRVKGDCGLAIAYLSHVLDDEGRKRWRVQNEGYITTTFTDRDWYLFKALVADPANYDLSWERLREQVAVGRGALGELLDRIGVQGFNMRVRRLKATVLAALYYGVDEDGKLKLP